MIVSRLRDGVFMEHLQAIYLCEKGIITTERDKCDRIVGILDGRRRLVLSKRLSGILRHFPEKYGVHLDRHGWASIKEVVDGLKKDSMFEWVEEWHVIGIAMYDEKGRFEIKNDKIRARYGHSIQVHIEPIDLKVPEILYHGTTAERLKNILKQGLKPMKRVMVHLTNSFDTAVETGKRHGKNIVVLEISSKCLEEKGYSILHQSKYIYTVEHVPPECIKKKTYLNL